MQSFLRKSNLLVVGLCALTVVAMTPSSADAVAKPKPGAGAHRGFRLFARSLGAITINRIYCGLATTGEVCVDSTNSSTIGGGFWPKGTADQYVFNSGLQIAGVVGSDGGPWAGDVTGAFFFDPKGTTQHGEQVEPIYNTTNPEDAAFVSDTTGTCNEVCQAAKVPSGDANQDLFFPLLRGRTSASQGDVWWLSWDGNPALTAGRPHPLGVLVEQRGMGWNFPAGNQDIIYFLYTFYNVTARDPAVYAAAGVRPGMRDILARQGAEFQDENEAAFGIDIPDGGYTVENMFAAFSADMDVAEATVNFSSVNVPFALGYVYAHDFAPAAGWTFDPTIFSPPFFPGSGFVGVKYLKSPVVNGAEVGLTLFSNTINGGAFDDAQNTDQLYRYLSNGINPALGDAPCNTGDPTVTKICFINNTAPDDMRFFQSSGPLTLGPGQFGTIAVAYIFAAPVIAAGCTGPGTCDLAPGDPTRLNNLATADNANPVDSVQGFTGYRSDAAPIGNANGIPDQGEFNAPVKGSLLDKALVAQQVFNFGFLLPFAPEAPDFFLVPGDNQVTVLWRPSPTETTGDPFFQVASQLTITDPVTGIVGPNPLYDPNYRQFDVEGYRIYRGRVDSPNELSLVAQFDYSGTFITDFTGQVNPSASCAPELGINLPVAVDTTTTPPDTTFGCPVDFDSLVPGVAPTVSNDVPLVGPIIQVVRGDRTTLATGEAIILKADTALTGAESGRAPELSDNNVPFIFVDNGVRSNLRYFYSVTAFDVNSIQSGPSNIESPRNTKSVTPSATATNVVSNLTLTKTITGRGTPLNSDAGAPALDPNTLTFSGPFPAANGWDISFVRGLASVLGGSGSFSARLDSIGLGNAWIGIPNTYYFTATTSAGALPTTVSVTQDFVEPPADGASPPFVAATVDASASRFGGGSNFSLYGQVSVTLPGDPFSNGFGRIVALGAQTEGFPELSVENGPRWFEGDNETTPHPTANYGADPSADFALWSNAGTLSGITLIHSPQAYLQGYGGVGTRDFEGVYAGAVRAADFKFYWGAGGAVDSVIDITHNVVVPFDTAMGGGWGFLTPASQTSNGSLDLATGVVSPADFMCVTPALQQGAGSDLACDASVTTTPYNLVPTATISPIQIGPDDATLQTAPPAGQTGFGLYMPGAVFIFGAAALPAQGTVWTLRSYTGAITADNTFFEQPRPLTAIGTEIQVQYTASNAIAAATKEDLERVHTVPDPYYVTSQFEQTTDTKIIKFVNLPADCIIRIYSSSGVLVDLLEHHTETSGGAEDWNVRNRNNQIVASGVYFYHIEAGDARRVGRFTVVNFAQ